eukprot:30966-Pelagococcus_subviridis.AAC.1
MHAPASACTCACASASLSTAAPVGPPWPPSSSSPWNSNASGDARDDVFFSRNISGSCASTQASCGSMLSHMINDLATTRRRTKSGRAWSSA